VPLPEGCIIFPYLTFQSTKIRSSPPLGPTTWVGPLGQTLDPHHWVGPLDPLQTWPISFPAPLLAPFPDPTMHNMNICSKQPGCVRKCEVGAWRVRLWPFGHPFAPFWQANGASPNLLQSCHFPEL